MEVRPLGRSGVKVSTVGLGGYGLGPEQGTARDLDQAAAAIGSSWAAGVNWLDTSERYHETENETLIGHALRKIGGDLLVSTKVAPRPRGTGFRADEIHAACRASLRRLQRERIDVYFLHFPDETGVPLEETWGAMAELVDAGLVGAIGLSNYELAQIERCHAQRAVDVVQDGLSLIDHLGARESIARCGELGIAAVVYEPLASGILSGKTIEQVRAVWNAAQERTFDRRLLAPGRAERSIAVAAGMRPIAQQLGVSVAQLAIAWVLHQPGVSAALVGSRERGHIHQNAEAAEIDLRAGLDELEELISLGPSFG